MGALLAWAIHWHWKGGLVARGRLVAGRTSCRVRRSTRATTATSSWCSSVDRSSATCASRCSGWRGSATPPSARPRRRRNAPGWPAPCTTACCRCWRWCSDREPPPAGEWAELGRLAGEQERGAALADPAAGHGAPAAGPAQGRPRRRSRGDGHRPPGAGRGGDARERRPARRARRRRRPSLRSGRASTTCSPTSDRTPRAWVLAEAAPDEVTVSVRDDGPGIAPGRVERGRSRGSTRRRLIDPRPHRGPRRHRDRRQRRLGHRVGADGAASVTRDHPRRPPLPRPRGRPRSRTTPARAPRRVGVPLDRGRRRRPGGPDGLVVAGGRRRAGTGARAARPRCRPRPSCCSGPAGASYSCCRGRTATWPTSSRASRRRPAGRGGWPSGTTATTVRGSPRAVTWALRQRRVRRRGGLVAAGDVHARRGRGRRGRRTTRPPARSLRPAGRLSVYAAVRPGGGPW